MSQFLGHFRYIMSENLVTVVSFSLFLFIIFLGLFGEFLAPYDPLATAASNTLRPPSWAHPFGTDNLGRDVLSRVIVATRLDLSIALSAVALSFVIGSALGSVAGFWGGWWDRIIGRFSDTIMAFPLFVLAMGIVAALGNTVENIIYATAIINLPFYIRVSRAETSIRREAGYVAAARLCGISEIRILATQVNLVEAVQLHLHPLIINPQGQAFLVVLMLVGRVVLMLARQVEVQIQFLVFEILGGQSYLCSL
ncbi:MAG: ABC transporter permease [Euryarchaeota archaeon]|nr:ABC transporter permease [Euryarchaeota archaeon]